MAMDLKSVGVIAGSVGVVAGLSLLSKFVTRTRSASESSDDEESDAAYERRARNFGYPSGAALAQNDAFTAGEFARSYHGANLDPMWEGSVKTPEDAIWAQQGAAKEYAAARRRMGLK